MNLSTNKNILLTGATGFIGKSLVEKLVEKNYIIHCLVRSTNKNFSALSKFPQINLVFIESFEQNELKIKLANLELDTVFNLAAYGVSQADRNHNLMIEGNISLLVNLLLAVQNHNIKKFIHIGTCSEYAPIQHGHSITEAHPLQPQALYGAAKVAASLYGQILAKQFNIPFITLRLFNIYGPGEALERLLPYTIYQLHNNQTVELTGGEQIRDWLYIDDVTDALLAAIDNNQITNQTTYNICSNQPYSIRNLVGIAVEYLQKNGSLLLWGKKPYRLDETMWLVGNNTRFRETTGWAPKIDPATGIKKLINHLISKKSVD